MTAQWYALQSKMMKEVLLWEQLRLHGVESYFPCLRVRPANPRARKLKAYFPGYVFARLDLDQVQAGMFLNLPGSAGIVSFGGLPCHVPDHLIAAIRRRVSQLHAMSDARLDGCQPGDRVRIQEGPFRGYEAILDVRLPGEERARVLVKFLNRPHLRLELPEGQIQPIKQ
jgi:transcriptional antiterminator RfaH